MKTLQIIINENREIFEIPNIFTDNEMQTYLGILLKEKIKFEFNGSYIMIMDNIEKQKKLINTLRKREYNTHKIAKDIKELMNIKTIINFDKNIDVIDTNFNKINNICFAFGLELKHAYNGLSGTDFELTIKK